MATKKHIIVVDDHPEFLELLEDFLTDEEYAVTAIVQHQGAFEQIKASHPDVVICDLLFGNVPAGWSLIEMLYLDPETRALPIILCSAATRQVQEVLPALIEKGITWLEKPFELEQLLLLLAEINQKQPGVSASKAAGNRKG